MKKIFSLFLGLVMVFALLPMTAFADDPTSYNIWVGGVQVTDTNKGNVLQGTENDGKVSFDIVNEIPTLTIKGGTNITGTYNNALIYAEGIDLTIDATDGGLTLNNASGAGVRTSHGSLVVNGDVNANTETDTLYAGKDLIVNGKADITVNSTTSGTYGMVASSGDLTVNGDVKVSGSAWYAIAAYRTLTLNGNATVGAAATDSFWSGMVAVGGFGEIILGGNADITATNEAIYSYNGITIPATHEITTPAGGKIDRNYSQYIVVDSSNAVAKHVVIGPHEHSGALNAGKPATCTTDGVKDYYTCSCGKAFEDENCTIEIDNLDTWKAEDAVIKALGHSFTNYVPNNDATCTKDGTKIAECDRCDAADKVTDEGTATGVHQDENNDGACDVCGNPMSDNDDTDTGTTNPGGNTGTGDPDQGNENQGEGTTPPPADDENQGGNTNPGNDVTPPTDGGETKPEDKPEVKPEETTKPTEENKPADPTPAPVAPAPAPRYTSPNTGDNTASLAMLAVVSGIALCGISLEKKKYNK